MRSHLPQIAESRANISICRVYEYILSLREIGSVIEANILEMIMSKFPCKQCNIQIRNAYENLTRFSRQFCSTRSKHYLTL